MIVDWSTVWKYSKFLIYLKILNAFLEVQCFHLSNFDKLKAKIKKKKGKEKGKKKKKEKGKILN